MMTVTCTTAGPSPAARRRPRPAGVAGPARVGETADSAYLAHWLAGEARRHRLLLATIAAAPAAARRRASA